MKRLTMDELSRRTNGEVSKPNISKYEAGKMMPSSRVHILLAQALGMDFDYFFRPVTAQITRPADYRKKAKLTIKLLSNRRPGSLSLFPVYIELFDP